MRLGLFVQVRGLVGFTALGILSMASGILVVANIFGTGGRHIFLLFGVVNIVIIFSKMLGINMERDVLNLLFSKSVWPAKE